MPVLGGYALGELGSWVGGGHQIVRELRGTQVAGNTVLCPSSLDKPGFGTCIRSVCVCKYMLTCAWLHMYMYMDVRAHVYVCTCVFTHV